MAITKAVTKVMPDENNVRYNLKLTDGVDVVIDRVYQDQYDPKVGPTEDNEKRIRSKMQKDIDAYKSKKADFSKESYGKSATNIENGLVI